MRCTIFRRNEESLASRLEEEKIPVNFSPLLVVMVVFRPCTSRYPNQLCIPPHCKISGVVLTMKLANKNTSRS
jgi:hypothetical protein